MASPSSSFVPQYVTALLVSLSCALTALYAENMDLCTSSSSLSSSYPISLGTSTKIQVIYTNNQISKQWSRWSGGSENGSGKMIMEETQTPQLWQWRRRPLYHSPKTGGMVSTQFQNVSNTIHHQMPVQ
jgi:hypothetical protein